MTEKTEVLTGSLVDPEFHLDARPWRGGIGVYLRGNCYEHGRKKYQAEGFVLTPADEMDVGELYHPLVLLRNQEAQVLMDELWKCGLRPSEGSGSAGALAATQRHLEDMRKLVFRNDSTGS